MSWQLKLQSLPASQTSAHQFLKPSALVHSLISCSAGNMVDQHPPLTHLAAMLARASSRCPVQENQDTHPSGMPSCLS